MDHVPDVPPTRIARPRQLLGQYGWLAAIAVAYLWVVPYFPRIQSANELPRVYLVKAIVNEGTFAIDRGVARWGGTADVSPHDGQRSAGQDAAVTRSPRLRAPMTRAPEPA